MRFSVQSVSGLVDAFLIGFLLPQAFPRLHLHTLPGSSQEHADHGDHHGSNSSDIHTHDPVTVAPDAPVPIVAIAVSEDKMGGYEVKIDTENFTFTPAAVTVGDDVQNEGHAHLYVNGVKVNRVYSNYYHVSESYFSSGTNEVVVSLNANSHGPWTVDGEPIQASTTVTVQ